MYYFCALVIIKLDHFNQSWWKHTIQDIFWIWLKIRHGVDFVYKQCELETTKVGGYSTADLIWNFRPPNEGGRGQRKKKIGWDASNFNGHPFRVDRARKIYSDGFPFLYVHNSTFLGKIPFSTSRSIQINFLFFSSDRIGPTFVLR